ncbi:GNAT family N-acetyltransferase [Tessaracoccus sp.]
MSVIYRGFRAGDLQHLADLTQSAMPRDAVSPERLAENVLLDVNFDPAGLIIATDADGTIVGFVYATHTEKGVPSKSENGYLTIGCVHPDHQRRGIGSELISRATQHLRERGATSITVAGYPHAYFAPGVDESAYPELARFLTQHGFEPAGTAAAMHIDLDRYAIPQRVQDLVQRRRDEGYAFTTAHWDDLPELISFASEKLAADWGHVVREAALRSGHGGRRTLIAREPGGNIVGFATYGAIGGAIERFGPFGVDETCRGAGLGRVLLHLTLTQMRAEGAHGGWFLWTGEDSPAGLLYLSAGFEVVRRFTVLRAQLHTQ